MKLIRFSMETLAFKDIGAGNLEGFLSLIATSERGRLTTIEIDKAAFMKWMFWLLHPDKCHKKQAQHAFQRLFDHWSSKVVQSPQVPWPATALHKELLCLRNRYNELRQAVEGLIQRKQTLHATNAPAESECDEPIDPEVDVEISEPKQEEPKRNPGRPSTKGQSNAAPEQSRARIVVLAEPINVSFAKEFVKCHFEALQSITVRGIPAGTMLLSFIARANSKGMIKTIWIERRGDSPFLSRLYSGVSGLLQLHPKLAALYACQFAHEAVPSALRGLSAFALPRPLRYLLRAGCDLVDIDQKNAHPEIQLERINESPEDYPPVPLLRRYCDDPEAFRNQTGANKITMLISLYYDTAPTDAHADVLSFYAEQALIRAADARKWAHLSITDITLQFYLNQLGEQTRMLVMERCIEQAGGKVAALESDGIPAMKLKDPQEVISQLPFKVSVKPMASTDEIIGLCREKWPEAPWDSMGKNNYELISAKLHCECLLEAGRTRCHKSFAYYVALTCKDIVAVSNIGATEFQIFDSKTCIWGERNKHVAELLVTSALEELAVYKSGYKLADNRMTLDITSSLANAQYDIIEDHSFKSVILSECKQFLCRKLPPSCNTPGTLLFLDGTCLDFATGTTFRPGPESRYSRHAAVPYEPFVLADDTKALVAEIVMELASHWEKHDHVESYGEGVDLMGRPDLVRKLNSLVESGHFPFLKAVHQLYNDWDRALYNIKWQIRITTGLRCFNEAWFLWGLGLSGKDTVVNCLTGLLGYDTDDGYVGTLKASYFAKSGKDEGSEGATSFLCALKDSRLCIISERKKHEVFDGDRLKPLTEQEGCRIAARRLFKHPESFEMTAAIIALSNHQLDLGDVVDDGIERRIRVDKMPRKFVPASKITPDSPDNWAPQDDTIKKRAKCGDFASEMVFLFQALYGSLFIRSGQCIEPIPREVAAETADVCNRTTEKKLVTWLIANCTPAESMTDATSQADVHKALDAVVHQKERAAAVLDAGMVKKSNGRGHHFYAWKFPEGTKAVPMKLK